MAKKFQPAKWPTLIAFTAFITLVSLGTWQLDRLADKTALLGRIEERMSLPAAPLPETLEDPAAWEYRRVTMAGVFMHDHEFMVRPRTFEGRSGGHLVVPFRRASGGMVFVNRGWISDDLLDKAARPARVAQVEGIVQLPARGRFTPANDPGRADWYWMDVAAMAQAAGLDAPMPVVVNASAREPGVYPAGGQMRLDIRNDHRQYALFWYGMSLVLLLVWFIYHWKREEE